MRADRRLRTWHQRTRALLLPILLISGLPGVAQKNAGRLVMTVSGESTGAVRVNGIDTPEPAADDASASTHTAINDRIAASRATKRSLQIRAIHEKPARTAAGRHIIVNVPDKKLYLMKNGKIIRQYSVLLGDTNEPTPIGEFRITEHIRSNSAVIGKAWMGFYINPNTDFYYGIHGLGPQHDETSTSGCVALKNDDVVDLYRRVSKGDPVTIIGTRGPFPGDDQRDASADSDVR